MVKGQSQTAGLSKHGVCSIFLDPFAGKLPYLVQWMSLEGRWFLIMLWSKVKVKLLVFEKMLSAQY